MRIPTADEIQSAALTVADENLLPHELMLTLCLGESGFGLQSFERWHRWTLEAQHALQNGDRQTLLNILQRCAAVGENGTDDISFGPAHQTWRWSPEYNGQRYDLDSILAMRDRYIEDHWHALRVAAANVGPKWMKHGDIVEACCRYNSPNMAGAQNPNRPNYLRAQAEAQKRLAALPPAGEQAPMIVYEDYRDPQPAGRFSKQPKGIILHGSRSGRAGNPLDAEYLGTARWAVNNPNDLGWNATIGDGKVAVHLTPQEWGWNARGASQHYLAVEIAQPTVNDLVTDGQVAALADWIKTRVLPVWPGLPMHFPTHAEVEASGATGQRDGKSDVYPAGDARADQLRARIMAALTGDVPAPASEYVVGQGIIDSMAARGDQPATDEIFVKHADRDAYSEAYGVSGCRYVYLPATGRVHRFEPAA